MLTEESLRIYQQRLREVEHWFQVNGIMYYVHPALPSEYYADASHPLEKGYSMLATRLFEQESFINSILTSGF